MKTIKRDLENWFVVILLTLEVAVGEHTTIGDNVVARKFCTRVVTQFVEYYAYLQRQNGVMLPPRQAFQPVEAKAFISHLSIYEMVGERHYQVRLHGTATENRTKEKTIKKNLLSYLPEIAQAWSWNYLLYLAKVPCGGVFLSREVVEHISFEVEVLHLPFADPEGAPRFILSVSELLEPNELLETMSTPRQLKGGSDVEFLDLGSGVGSSAEDLEQGWS